jgi:hypothetical protein
MALAALLVVFSGCGKDARPAANAPSSVQPVDLPAASTAVTAPACVRYGKAVQRGRLTSARLREISGLAASARHKGVLWGHNDAGKNKARLFAISTTGKHLATWRLKGVKAVDTEDIAVAPCAPVGPRAASSCIYLADVGDNEHKRAFLTVYRVEEPATLPAPAAAGQPVPKERLKKKHTEHLRFEYPPAARFNARQRGAEEHANVEAMVVLPDTRVVLISKRADGIARVYRAPPDPAGIAIAEGLGDLELRVPPGNIESASKATGADLSRDGRWLAVRTYSRLFVFDVGAALAAPAGSARTALARAPRVEIKSGFDSQGEAVCWDPQGGLWHTSESVKKTVNVPLWRIECLR